MPEPIPVLLELTRRLSETRGLGPTLQAVVDCAVVLTSASAKSTLKAMSISWGAART